MRLDVRGWQGKEWQKTRVAKMYRARQKRRCTMENIIDYNRPLVNVRLVVMNHHFDRVHPFRRHAQTKSSPQNSCRNRVTAIAATMLVRTTLQPVCLVATILIRYTLLKIELWDLTLERQYNPRQPHVRTAHNKKFSNSESSHS